MGCLMETPARVHQKNVKREPEKNEEEEEKAEFSFEKYKVILRNDFNSILQGITAIPKPNPTYPVVCFSDLSLPLILANLCLEDGDSTGVSLPLIGITRFQKGKVSVVGNIKQFVLSSKDNTDASAFLENIVKWTSGVARGRVGVLFLGLPIDVSDQLADNMSGFGFKIRIQDTFDEFERTNVVICQSDYNDRNNELLRFVEAGGGLICCGVDPEKPYNPKKFVMNKVLSITGVGFPHCSLIAGPIDADTIKVNIHVSLLHKYTFRSLVSSFRAFISQESYDLSLMDSIVTSLKYNLNVMPHSFNQSVVNLHELAIEFLKRTNYENDDGICPDLVHGVTSILLCDIHSKMPAQCFENMDLGMRFPGSVDYSLVKTKTNKIKVQISNDGWATTGIWIPSGTICHVVPSVAHQRVSLQIGSHTECLFSKPGPWKRWPLVVTSFELNGETTIGSPFGGLLYVVSETIAKDNTTIELEITNSIRAPYYNVSDPDVWELTRNIPLPWTEIRSRFALFTLPTSVIKSLSSVEASIQSIDSLIEAVIDNSGFDFKHHFRIVFDVELPEEGPICGYPIVLSVDSAQKVFSHEEPSPEQYLLISFISILTFPDGDLLDDQESSLSDVISCFAFIKRWPTINPLDFKNTEIPTYFQTLWNISIPDKGVSIKKSLQKVRASYLDKGNSVTFWDLFLIELSKIKKINIADLFKISKNTSSLESIVPAHSSKSLQDYILNHDM